MPYRPSLVSPTLRPVLRPLVQQVFGYFDPLKLDPYLYFDTRESMVGTLENPTLDLDPSKPETLDVITATRSGTATYTDANGNIATAAADTVRVDYTQGEELTPTKFQNIGYTDFANSYWIARGFTKVGTVDGPLGYTGYEFLENNSNSNPAVHVNSDLSDGSFQTFGVWLKASSPISIALATTGSNRTSTINVTTEWQFFSCTDNFNGTGGPHIGGFATITQGSGVTLFAAMPQLEEGTTASDFVENTTGSPKFIASATYGPRVPMILVEPSATNLVADSNTFGKASGVVRLGTDFEGPDGTNTAEGYGSIPATNGEKVSSTVASVSANTEYVSSVWVKGEAGKTAKFFAKRSGGGTYVASSIVTVTLTGEWQRVTGMVMTTLSDNTGITINLLGSSSGTSADEVYLWGAQVETGSVATSYIPTSGSTVTRQADDLVISGSDFTDFYNSSEGTVYIELTSKDDGRNSYPVYFTQNGAGFAYRNNGTWAIQKDGIPNMYLVSWANGGFVSDSLIILGSYTAGDLTRVSVSYDSNSYEGSKDGASVATSTPTTMATTLVDRLYVGGSADFQNSSRIKRLIYWPYSSDRL